MTSTDISKPLIASQLVLFPPNEENNSIEVVAQKVTVSSRAGNHNHGCSKVKLKNKVDYNWENRLYTGQLLAVHMDANFIAYSVKASASGNGMVRVAHLATDKRLLLKGMQGLVQDLSFAFISAQIILASIDEHDNIFIHNIELQNDELKSTLLLHVVGTPGVGSEHRVVWCPYIPDDENDPEETDEESSRLLVSTHGNKACMWNIGQIVAKYGSGSHTFDNAPKPCLVIEEHTDVIIDAAFSPDGTAVATASRDGYAMFFQVNFLQMYVHSDAPKCLHRWSPHDGKPLSCLFFLDNHSRKTEWFWKFAVTGADNNSILKIWSLKSWVCLQTIEFTPSPEFPIIGMKAGLDKSARYLILSDVYRRVLFILQMELNSDDTEIFCKSVSEFCLPYPILSFGFIDAGLRTFKCPSSCADPFHLSNDQQGDSPIDEEQRNDDLDDEDLALSDIGEAGTEGCNVKAVIRLYLVQPKSLLEGQITFVPPVTSAKTLLGLKEIKNDAINLPDVSQDLSTSNGGIAEKSMLDSSQDDLKNTSLNSSLQPSAILAHQSQQLKNLLMRAQAPSGGLLKQPPSPLPASALHQSPLAPLLQPLTPSAPAAPAVPPPPLNLMTPDAFSSPAKRDEEDPMLATSPEILRSAVLEKDLQIISKGLSLDSSVIKVGEPIKVFPANPAAAGSQLGACDGKPGGSGGSSPSREVQEILSLKGSDCFFEDELEEDSNGRPEETPAADSDGIDQMIIEDFPPSPPYHSPEREIGYSLPNMEQMLQHNKPPTQTSGIAEAGDNFWENSPHTLHSKLDESNKSYNNESVLVAEVDQRNVLNEKVNNYSKGESEKLRMLISDNDEIALHLSGSADDNGNAFTLKSAPGQVLLNELTKMLITVRKQNEEIAMLRAEIKTVAATQHKIVNDRMEESNSVVQLVGQMLQENQLQMSKMIDAAIITRADTDRTNREVLLSGVSQAMGAQLGERLSSAMGHEARHTLVPQMERLMEPAVRHLNTEFARKLTATDHLLTENIAKLVNNKSVMEGLSTNVAQMLNRSTKEAFKEAIQSSLVPAMEKAQTQMFKQLTQTFTTGTKEYLNAFENCTKRALERSTIIDEACSQINTVSSQLQHVLDQQNKQYILNSQTQQAIKQLNTLTKDLQSAIAKTLQGAFETQMEPIRECIKEQISTGMATHVAQLEDSVLLAVRSRTQTPAPTVMDMQTQQNMIDQLLNSGQINSAFQQALSASDLRLVVHACASADLRKVFSQPCPLQQHVLLSLIQQLGADMTSDTRLKHSYLEEAVMNLDSSYPVTREHMPAVLKALQKQLTAFIASNPYNEANRNLKVLILATDALLRPGGPTDNMAA